MKKFLNKFNCFWWLILLTTVSILASFFWLNFNLVPQVEIDSNLYIKLADVIEKFKLPNLAHRSPLLPTFIAVGRKFGGLKAVVMIQILMGAITICLAYKIIETISKNKTVAGLTALILAFDPLVISHQTAIMSETLGLFMLTLFILMHLSLTEQITKKRLVITIIIDILLFLTKPVFLILAIGMYMWHLISSWMIKIKQEKLLIRKKMILMALLINLTFIQVYQYKNYLDNNFWGISVISQINLLGKMIQYGYLDQLQIKTETPEDVKLVTLAYLKNPKEKSPYSVLSNSLKPNSPQELMAELPGINKYLLDNKLNDYVVKTIKLVPKTFNQDRNYYDSISFDSFKIIKRRIELCFNKINQWKFLSFVLWLMFLGKLFFEKKYREVYQIGIVLITVAYIMIMNAAFSHGDYTRLRLPVEIWLNTLIVLPLIYFVKEIYNFLFQKNND